MPSVSVQVALQPNRMWPSRILDHKPNYRFPHYNLHNSTVRELMPTGEETQQYFMTTGSQWVFGKYLGVGAYAVVT